MSVHPTAKNIMGTPLRIPDVDVVSLLTQAIADAQERWMAIPEQARVTLSPEQAQQWIGECLRQQIREGYWDRWQLYSIEDMGLSVTDVGMGRIQTVLKAFWPEGAQLTHMRMPTNERRPN